jgi:trehalose-6-phosphate synthase
MTDALPELDHDTNPLIVIASNRGPYSFTQTDSGDFESKRGSGGLVTALGALAEQLDVLWIASALSDDDKAWAQCGRHQPAPDYQQ